VFGLNYVVGGLLNVERFDKLFDYYECSAGELLLKIFDFGDYLFGELSIPSLLPGPKLMFDPSMLFSPLPAVFFCPSFISTPLKAESILLFPLDPPILFVDIFTPLLFKFDVFVLRTLSLSL
jgi:hypothetical protein